MSLQSRIENDYKQAFRANDRPAVSAWRMLKSSIKNREIEVGRELTDEETIEVITREVKKRREASEQFGRGGRPDLATKEQADVALYQKYLPEQLTEQELQGIVRQAITDVGATGPSDIGKVMAAVMAKVKGRADGSAVQVMVKKTLGA
ncbi:MAG: GatB/YqeY domain-containing protein [Candidatus Kerfeldbacteria bacterium]|nr:GatB/YqeY domain-containing protein [Candidatus Kerfeldbacteria bacterium]